MGNKYLDIIRDLQEKNKKLWDAIEYYEIGATDVAVHNEAERKILHECVRNARSIRECKNEY